jgi:hypothetical protein
MTEIPDCADRLFVARESIANLKAITSRILETQRALGDAQRRLEEQLAAVAGDVEERWQAIAQQLAAVGHEAASP